MDGKSVASSKSNEGGHEVSARLFRGEVLLGDMIWVKLDGSSWWLGQVTDENAVSGGFKPCKRSDGNVLVRLYGSYEYKYVDPIKCCSDFSGILEQNNGRSSEILLKTLELHRSCLKSGRSRARSKFIGSTDVIIDSVKDKKSKHKNHKQLHRKLESSASIRFTEQDRVKKINGNRKRVEEEAKCQTPKQDMLHRKCKLNDPTGTEAANGKLSGQDGKHMPTRKRGEPEDDRIHDERNRKLVTHVTDKTSAKEGKVPKSPELQKEVKQNSQTMQDMKIKTPRQDTAQNDQRLNSPSSGPRTYGTLPKLSTSRRLRVMQDLGLAAPDGSPFGKN